MTACQVCLLLILAILGNGEDFSGTNDNSDNRFNVVLILAKTDSSQNYNEDSGVRFLNFVETKRVKHCAPGNLEDDSFEPPSNDCEELLKSGIYSLISFSRNVMGMTTAVASVENDTFSNGLRFKKSTSEDLEIRFHLPRKMRRRFRNRQFNPHLITQPEHTEVFQIRSKRQFHVNNHEEEGPTDENDQNWDIFGLKANIKLTFFGKLFDQEQQNQKPAKLQNNFMNQLGQVAENSLFDLVKETLSSVQDNQNGFLMIILGGCLKEIADAYSPLMQSVKHVIENTNPQNTLIVLTGQCPTGIKEGTEQDQFLIPVYIRGSPKCSAIAISEQLYDVPYAIKNVLVEINGGSYLSNDQTQRAKRTAPEKRNSHETTQASLLVTLIIIFLPNL